VNVV